MQICFHADLIQAKGLLPEKVFLEVPGRCSCKPSLCVFFHTFFVHFRNVPQSLLSFKRMLVRPAGLKNHTHIAAILAHAAIAAQDILDFATGTRHARTFRLTAVAGRF